MGRHDPHTLGDHRAWSSNQPWRLLRGAGDSLIWFSGIYLCFMDLGISKIYHDSTIVTFHFLKRSETAIVLDPRKYFFNSWCPPGLSNFSNIDRYDFFNDPFFIDPKLPEFHFMFCSGYWQHLRKMPSMFSGRVWSHIQDFQDAMRRIFIIFWCPTFPKSPKFWKSRVMRYANKSVSIDFVFF